VVAAVDLFFSTSLVASDDASLSDQACDWWSGLYLEIGIAILLVIVIDIVAERLLASRLADDID
jgi:hypothetical protein